MIVRNIKTPHFIIKSDKEIKYASRLSKLLEGRLRYLKKELSFFEFPKKRISVVFCYSLKEYSKSAKRYGSWSWWRWSQGCGNHKLGIILNITRISELGKFDKNDDIIPVSPYTLRIIGHELFHVISEKYFHKEIDVPAWIKEGLAEYYGGNNKIIKTKSKSLLFNLRWSKNLFAFEDYTLSANAILYLIKRYGKRKLINFLKESLKCRDILLAFKKVYGFDLDSFEKLFQKKSKIIYAL